VDLWIVLLDALWQWHLLNVAEPIHEEEASFSMGVRIAQEVSIHGLQHRAENHKLADCHTNAPDIKRVGNRDATLRVADQEDGPFW